MRKKLVREMLLDAAERLMGTHMLSKITMKDVAREAGVGEAGAFRSFPGKKALVMGLLDRYEARLFALRDQHLEKLSGAPGGRLKAALMALAEHPQRDKVSLPNMLAILSDEDEWDRIAEIRIRLYRETCEGEDPDRVARVMRSFDNIMMAETFARHSQTASVFQKAFGDLLESLEKEGEAPAAAGSRFPPPGVGGETRGG